MQCLVQPRCSAYVTIVMDMDVGTMTMSSLCNAEHSVRWCKQNRLCLKADLNTKLY